MRTSCDQRVAWRLCDSYSELRKQDRGTGLGLFLAASPAPRQGTQRKSGEDERCNARHGEDDLSHRRATAKEPDAQKDEAGQPQQIAKQTHFRAIHGSAITVSFT